MYPTSLLCNAPNTTGRPKGGPVADPRRDRGLVGHESRPGFRRRQFGDGAVSAAHAGGIVCSIDLNIKDHSDGNLEEAKNINFYLSEMGSNLHDDGFMRSGGERDVNIIKYTGV